MGQYNAVIIEGSNRSTRPGIIQDARDQHSVKQVKFSRVDASYDLSFQEF